MSYEEAKELIHAMAHRPISTLTEADTRGWWLAKYIVHEYEKAQEGVEE